MLHWLIVIPYYFLGAILLAGLLAVACRLLRVAASMDRLAAVATIGSIAALTLLIATGAVGIGELTLLPLLVLGLISFVVAGLDALLAPGRPLASERDEEGRPTAAPQIQ